MTNSNCVYIDVGNTDIKWQKDEQSAVQRCTLSDFSSHSKLYQDIEQAQRSFISCMKHHPHYQKLQTMLKPFAVQWINAVPTNSTIKLAYQEPNSYGIDRYLSLLASRDYAPLILADLGTAITIDMMSSKSQHIGGWILPGLPMIEQQFQHYGLFSTNNISKPHQLGTDTPAAITNGYQSMLLIFLQSLTENYQHYGLTKPNLILSGGNAQQLSPYLTNWQNKPNLVLQGLRELSLTTKHFR